MRKENPDNRSTLRTKAAIREAFLAIVAKKPVDAITVQELIDLANVSRTTFYRYYYDIYDLLDTIENQIIDEVGQELEKLENQPIKVNGGYPTISCVVRGYYKHAETIRLLNGPNVADSFDERMQDKIYEVTRRLRSFKEGERFRERLHRLYSCYVISGGIRVINELLAEEKPWDPERVGRILDKMAASGERVFLEEMEGNEI